MIKPLFDRQLVSITTGSEAADMVIRDLSARLNCQAVEYEKCWTELQARSSYVQRDAVIEECAKVCDDIAASNRKTLDAISPGDTMNIIAVTLTGAVSSAKICASTIRTLARRCISPHHEEKP